MKRTILATVAAGSLAIAAEAAPITYEMELTASYGSSYGGSAVLEPITWSFGFTFDPETITPSGSSAGNGNTRGSYDGTTGITGYLHFGSQVAVIDQIEAQFSTASLNRHSFVIRFVIDGRTPLWDPACFASSPYPYLCPDLDQDDGLSLNTAAGTPSPIDVNTVQFSFGGNNSTVAATGDRFFTGPGALEGAPLDWLDDPAVIVSSTMNVHGYGIYYSNYGALTGTVTDVGPLKITSGSAPAIPLPATGWLVLGALGCLVAVRRAA